LPLFISRAGYGSVMTGAGCTAVMFHPTKAHLLPRGAPHNDLRARSASRLLDWARSARRPHTAACMRCTTRSASPPAEPSRQSVRSLRNLEGRTAGHATATHQSHDRVPGAHPRGQVSEGRGQQNMTGASCSGDNPGASSALGATGTDCYPPAAPTSGWNVPTGLIWFRCGHPARGHAGLSVYRTLERIGPND